MDEQSKRFPLGNLVLPGVILAVLAYYGYVALMPKLESARPEEPSDAKAPGEATGQRQLARYARLWEDPLGPGYRDVLKDKDKSVPFEAPDVEYRFWPLLLPVMVGGGRSACDAEERMKTRYAVIAALATGKYRPVASEQIHFWRLRLDKGRSIVIPYEHFQPDLVEPVYDDGDSAHFSSVLVCWLDEDVLGSQPQKVIAALHWQALKSWKEEDHKRPRRDSLSREVKRLSPPGLHLHVIGPSTTDMLLKMAGEGKTEPVSFADCVDGAVLYSPRATVDPAAVKVKTILSSSYRFSEILRWFTGRDEGAVENAAGKSSSSHPFHQILPWLSEIVRRVTGREGDGKSSDKSLAKEDRGKPAMTFVRVIGTDGNLADAISEELRARDAWPRPSALHECVVLVTEKDTFYGRAVPFLFSQLMPETAAQDFSAWRDGAGREKIEFGIAGGSQIPGVPEWFSMTVAGDKMLDAKDSQVGWRRYFPKEEELVDEETSKDDVWDLRLGEGAAWRSARLRIVRDKEQATSARLKLSEPFVVYNYLRGIDGSQPSEAGARPRERSERDLRAIERAAGYDPTGTSQLDYLRRLGDALEELHRRQRKDKGRGILAVGVIGTDIYDRLLVLRALRKRLPDAVFFTNDLNANLFRLSELEYTRNTVVASHFGLALHPSLQRDVPPFRDSYQTSTFLATLLAIREDRAEAAVGALRKPGQGFAKHLWPPFQQTFGPHQLLRPLVFEIGLNGPYQLTETGGVLPPSPGYELLPDAPHRTPPPADRSLPATIHPPSPGELPKLSGRQWWGAVVALATIGLLLAMNLKHVRGFFRVVGSAFARLGAPLVIVAWMFLLAPACVLLFVITKTMTVMSGRRRGRRIIASLTAMVGWLKTAFSSACQRLKRQAPTAPASRWRILVMVPDVAVVAAALATVALVWVAWNSHASQGGEPFELLAGVSVWPSILIEWLAFLLSGVLLRSGLKDLKASEKEIMQSAQARPSGASGPKAPGVYRRLWEAVAIGDWEMKEVSTDRVLRTYFSLGNPGLRLVRLCVLTVPALLLIGGLLSAFDDWPQAPCRGPLARSLSYLMLALSVAGFLALSFFVIDATFLCQRFLDNLFDNLSLHEVNGRDCRVSDADEAHAAVHWFARRSHVVGTLMLYPFLVLVMLILAWYPAFDRWRLSWSLIVVAGIVVIGLLGHHYALRRRADKTKREILRRLRHAVGAGASAKGFLAEYVAQRADDIERESEGAFRPWMEEYSLKSLAILVGGSGGIAALDQILSLIR